jgi:hypothetical protein
VKSFAYFTGLLSQFLLFFVICCRRVKRQINFSFQVSAFWFEHGVASTADEETNCSHPN